MGLEIPAREADFKAADQVLLDPPRVQQKSLVLLISLSLFVAVSFAQGTTRVLDLATLVGVLLFHELGHAAAMLLFGYRDVRIFFIPFFGAAASGQRRGVSRWKQALVLLAGPIPGIVVGAAIAMYGQPSWRVLSLQLLIVNVINLMPVAPLDGGQLFSVLLFSRQRHLEVVFSGVTVALVTAYSIYSKLWGLAAVGYVLLVTLGHRMRVLGVAHRWRDKNLGDDPKVLDEDTRRELWQEMWQMLPPKWQTRWRGHARPQAATMQEILERAAQHPPSWATSAGILVVWAAAAALAVGATYSAVRSPRWHLVEHQAPHFMVEMPGAEHETEQSGARTLVATVGAGRAYTVSWSANPQGDPATWLAAAGGRLQPSGSTAVELPAPAGERRFTFQLNGLQAVARLVAAHSDQFVVLAMAPTQEPDSMRFVESFRP